MDQIRDTLGRLGELSNEELSQLSESIVSEFETVNAQDLSPQVVETMTELAAAVEAVRAESSRREEELAELSRLRDEAAAKIQGAQKTDTVAEDNEPTAEPVTEAAASTPAETESVASTVTELSTEETPTVKTESVVATGETVDSPLPEGGDPAPVVAEKLEPKIHNEEVAANKDVATEVADASTEDASAKVVAEANKASGDDNGSDDDNNNGKDSEGTVTASAADQGPDVQAPASARPQTTGAAKVSRVITAGADIPGVAVGSELPSMSAIAEAMAKRMHGMRRTSGGDGEQHTVATLVASFPEDRILRSGESESNKEKIENVAGPEAITAAGGFCAPLETNYDILGFGTTNRPVRDSLASFNADRGGIRWMNTPILGDIPTYDYTGPSGTQSIPDGGVNSGATAGQYPNGAAISVWNIAADESAVDGSPTKPCFRVQCIGESTAYLEAVPVCLTIGNLMARAFPELIEANNNLALVTHARFSEQRLLRKIGALSTQVSAARVLGAARDFFNQVDIAAVSYRQRHRLGENEPMRVVVPTWLKNLIRADLVMEMPGNGQEGNFALADSRINQWFAIRNINVTWHIDGEAGQYFGPQAAGALVSYPSTVVWYMYAEGTFLFLDGGTLDLGLVRDSTLNATNDYKMFVETFEGVAKRGPESLRVASSLKATGAAAGLVNTSS